MPDDVKDDLTEMEQRTLIATACSRQLLTIERWDTDDEEGRLRAWIEGQWAVVDDDENRGLYEGSTGQLFAIVVGGKQHGNVQVKFYLQEEGMDSATADVTPGVEVEQI